MANTHETLTSLFADIADSIQDKTGSKDTIAVDEFPTAIAAIPSLLVEFTLIKEITSTEYNEYAEKYGSTTVGFSGSQYNTSKYEALWIVAAHGACSSSSGYMGVRFNEDYSISTTNYSYVVIPFDVTCTYSNTMHTILVNDADNSIVYTGGIYIPSAVSTSGKTYSSKYIFNDNNYVGFRINSTYDDGYYAVYGINGLSAIVNLLPRNS